MAQKLRGLKFARSCLVWFPRSQCRSQGQDLRQAAARGEDPDEEDAEDARGEEEQEGEGTQRARGRHSRVPHGQVWMRMRYLHVCFD